MDLGRGHRAGARSSRVVGSSDASRQGAALVAAGRRTSNRHSARAADARLGSLARPCAMAAYHPAYVPFKWRGWWDFGSGGLGDMGIHNIAPVFAALKLGAPLSVQASSTP